MGFNFLSLIQQHNLPRLDEIAGLEVLLEILFFYKNRNCYLFFLEEKCMTRIFQLPFSFFNTISAAPIELTASP